MTAINLLAAHVVSTTATGSLFYFEAMREAVLINCKSFGSMQPVGGAETKANCFTFEFADCRGIVMTGCSSAFSKKHGIRVAAATRASSGFFISGHTYETINGCLIVVGTATFKVTNINHYAGRIEGAVTGSPVTFDLTHMVSGQLHSADKTVRIDATCDQISLWINNFPAITDAGKSTTLFGTQSDLSPAVVKAYGIDIDAGGVLKVGVAGNQTGLEISSGTFSLKSSAQECARVEFPWVDGAVALMLLVNRGGTRTLSTV